MAVLVPGVFFMKYKHILLTTDLTDLSKNAAKKARALADQCKATLDIVHVIEHSPVAYGGEFSIPIDVNLNQAIEVEANKALAKQALKLEIPDKRQHLLNGSVKHCVVELATKLKADLIIVGTHEQHGLDALLGSRANAILHGAKCDILAIRANE